METEGKKGGERLNQRGREGGSTPRQIAGGVGRLSITQEDKDLSG